MAVQGRKVDMARFMVAMAPNMSAYRQQLDKLLTDQCGALRQENRPLELQKVPEQADLFGQMPEA